MSDANEQPRDTDEEKNADGKLKPSEVSQVENELTFGGSGQEKSPDMIQNKRTGRWGSELI